MALFFMGWIVFNGIDGRVALSFAFDVVEARGEKRRGITEKLLRHLYRSVRLTTIK